MMTYQKHEKVLMAVLVATLVVIGFAYCCDISPDSRVRLEIRSGNEVLKTFTIPPPIDEIGDNEVEMNDALTTSLVITIADDFVTTSVIGPYYLEPLVLREDPPDRVILIMAPDGSLKVNPDLDQDVWDVMREIHGRLHEEGNNDV